VVGGCGSLNWWKAPELFILVAHRLRTRRPEASVRFVWVGGTLRSADHERLCHDVDRLGLGGIVRFLGTQVDPHRYFAVFDTFLLTSREDAFPFVCVEAAALGLPIVCFERSGGAPEIVGDDAGFVVPYLDLAAVADHLALLMDDPALRHRLGEQGASKARERYTLEQMGQQLGSVLDRYLPHPHGNGRPGEHTMRP
jgi:glycosyltransferase involved in cell wall biosynthesis